MKKLPAICCLLLLPSFAWAGNAPPTVAVEEMKIEKYKPTPGALGEVFDVRNPLCVTLTAGRAGETREAADSLGRQLRELQALTEATVQGARALQRLRATLRVGDVPGVAAAADAAGDQLTAMGLEALDVSLSDAAVARGGNAMDVYGSYFTVVREFAAERAAKIRAAVDTAEVRFAVDVVQTRAIRRDRVYPSNFVDLLQISPAEQELAGKLQPDKLREALRVAIDTVNAGLAGYIRAELEPALRPLRQRVGTGNAALDRIVARIDGLRDLKAAGPEQAYLAVMGLLAEVLADAQSLDLPGARTEILALQDAISRTLRGLPGKFRDLIQCISDIAQVEELARETRRIVLRAGNSATLTVGDSRLVPRPDVAFDLSNGDGIEVIVRSADPSNARRSEELLHRQSARAYRLGWNWVRTVSVDGFEEIQGKRVKTTPAVNFLAKRFTRKHDHLNTWASVGFGLTWFVFGVDQAGDGSQQTAAGVALSLLDDWVTVGYGRNFIRNHYFPYVGAHIPLKF